MSEEIIPILKASDAAVLSDWYARLGFQIEGEHRFAPDLPLYRMLRRGSVRLHLSEHRGDAKCPGLCYFTVSNLDEIAREFSKNIIEQPWGREVKLVDPDGNRFRIVDATG